MNNQTKRYVIITLVVSIIVFVICIGSLIRGIDRPTQSNTAQAVDTPKRETPAHTAIIDQSPTTTDTINMICSLPRDANYSIPDTIVYDTQENAYYIERKIKQERTTFRSDYTFVIDLIVSTSMTLADTDSAPLLTAYDHIMLRGTWGYRRNCIILHPDYTSSPISDHNVLRYGNEAPPADDAYMTGMTRHFINSYFPNPSKWVIDELNPNKFKVIRPNNLNLNYLQQ